VPLDTTWPTWILTSSNTTATTTTWDTWTSNTTATTTSTSTSASTNAWIRWNDGTSTAARVMDSWVEWVDEYGQRRHARVSNGGNYTYCRPHTAPPPETEEQKAARLEREAERKRVWEEKQKAREAANIRARQLLDSLLDADQQAELEAEGHFHVTAPSGRRYRIHRNSISGNVELAAEPGGVAPSRRWRYCAHGRGADELPTNDHLVMQALALMTDEDGFLAIANRS
jgi:hypothetical protein